MPTVIARDEIPLPVIYGSWAEWRRDRSEDDAAPATARGARSFCAACWGQGSIHSPAGNGEGLVPSPCSWCGGDGTVGPRR